MLKQLLCAVKQSTIGAFEVCLFMQRGINRYCNSKKQMWWSFALPVVLGLVTYQISMQISMDGSTNTGNIPYTLILGTAYVSMLISLVLNLLILLVFSKIKSKIADFPKLVSVTNWTYLPFTIFPLLVNVLRHIEVLAVRTADNLGMVLVLYSVAVVSYIITKTLNVHFAWGIVFAVFGVYVSIEVSNILYYLWNVPRVS